MDLALAGSNEALQMTLNRHITICRYFALVLAIVVIAMTAMDIRAYRRLYPNGMCLDFVPEQAFYQSCLTFRQPAD